MISLCYSGTTLPQCCGAVVLLSVYIMNWIHHGNTYQHYYGQKYTNWQPDYSRKPIHSDKVNVDHPYIVSTQNVEYHGILEG